ncbi:3',5'-cyclic AMP phosphodiesterase CpdA [Paraburkholderia sp. BL8N3]|jgi:3',5'-cyclic AMP phosphodiesterase CpdA|nr:phosphodiesterase [Paraburkholderia sp. BL8N3]TCK34914.1 3',5'-cyclic AMP phosphodiesterase CpdA [Paraburkholderia sp. BL8N3]
MLLAQISDLHIKQPGALAYRKIDTAACLRRCVERLNALVPRPDAVLVTGDLTDFGTREEYAHLAALLEPLELPVYLMVGNHDDRAALRSAFDAPYLHAAADFVHYAFDLGELRIIAMDSQAPGGSAGTLCDARLDWLAAQLDAAGGRPAIVALHHPPFRTGIGHMDEIALDTPAAAKLAALIGAHPNVERVLCGHLHRPISVRFAGTIASTAPSTAHQVVLDLRPDAPSALVLEPPAFTLHQWQPDTGVISHHAYVDTFDGPYPFFNAGGKLVD